MIVSEGAGAILLGRNGPIQLERSLPGQTSENKAKPALRRQGLCRALCGRARSRRPPAPTAPSSTRRKRPPSSPLPERESPGDQRRSGRKRRREQSLANDLRRAGPAHPDSCLQSCFTEGGWHRASRRSSFGRRRFDLRVEPAGRRPSAREGLTIRLGGLGRAVVCHRQSRFCLCNGLALR